MNKECWFSESGAWNAPDERLSRSALTLKAIRNRETIIIIIKGDNAVTSVPGGYGQNPAFAFHTPHRS